MSIFLFKSERKELEWRLDAAWTEVASARTQLDAAIEEKHKAVDAAKKITKERDELKEIVREQTEADLLINALKAVGVIKESPKGDYFRESAYLQERLSRAQGSNAGYQAGNALGGLIGLTRPFL